MINSKHQNEKRKMTKKKIAKENEKPPTKKKIETENTFVYFVYLCEAERIVYAYTHNQFEFFHATVLSIFKIQSSYL